VPGLPGPLMLQAAVFSQTKLDAGTKLLLEHFPKIDSHSHIIDLGCGCGVLGLHAMQTAPTADVTFVDESSAAIKSARHNVATLFPGRNAHFKNQNGLQPQPERLADLILCNPPYHAGHVVVSSTAQIMFEQSLQALHRGGMLLIVGNRHLDYGKRLQRVFGHHKLVADNHRFQVFFALRR